MNRLTSESANGRHEKQMTPNHVLAARSIALVATLTVSLPERQDLPNHVL